MNTFCVVLLASFVSIAFASGIFDRIWGDITLEVASRLDLDELRSSQVLVYGSGKRVPVDVIEFALEHGLADVNAIDAQGNNSLFYAARANDIEAVKTLIDYGARKYYGALFHAAKIGTVGMAKLLIEKFKHVISASDLRRIVEIASFGGHLEVVRLISDTADALNFDSVVDEKTLDQAAKSVNANTEVIEFLLRRGAKVTVSALKYAFDLFDIHQEYVNFLFLLKAAGPEARALLNAKIECGGVRTTLKKMITERVMPAHVYLAIEELEDAYTSVVGDEAI